MPYLGGCPLPDLITMTTDDILGVLEQLALNLHCHAEEVQQQEAELRSIKSDLRAARRLFAMIAEG